MSNDYVFGKEELARKFQALEENVQGTMLVNVVRAGGNVIVNAAKDNIKAQGLIRTRTLSRSIHQEVAEQTTTRAAVDVGTNVEYAAIHEFGGTISAKTSKYLAIPVGNYTGSPRKYGDLRVRKTAKGTLLLVDGSQKVQYVLKQSVDIPARPYLRPAADEHTQGIQSEMTKAFGKLIDAAVKS